MYHCKIKVHFKSIFLYVLEAIFFGVDNKTTRKGPTIEYTTYCFNEQTKKRETQKAWQKVVAPSEKP